MNAVLFSPHNDDCELFASYSALRHRPHVVVCLRSVFQERYGVTPMAREAETDAAMRVLGCGWEQWPFPDVRPDWKTVEEAMRRLDEERHPELVFAPAHDFPGNGHSPDEPPEGHFGVLHHDWVGLLAEIVFGHRLRAYTTYLRHGGRQTGTPVPFEPGWPELKLEALACYPSQRALESTAKHFVDPLPEYLRP